MAEYTAQTPSPDLRLFGEEWIDHGYKVTHVVLTEPGPCPVCGAPNQTCIGEQNHGEG